MDQARTPAPGSEAKLHFLDYWRIIRIRKAVIILVFLLVSVTATFVTFILTKYYASHAQIEVHLPTTDVPTMNGQSMTQVYDPYFLETEFEVIRSQVILDRVIDKLNLNEKWTEKFNSPVKLKTADTREALKNMIDVSAVRNTSLIDITVYDTDKDEAAQLAQAIAEVYRDYRTEEWGQNLTRGIESLSNDMVEFDNEISMAESNVTSLYTNLQPGDFNPIGNQGAPGQNIEPAIQMAIQQEIIQENGEAARQETTLSKLTTLSPDALRQTVVNVSGSPDPILTEEIQELDEARTKEVDLASRLGPQHPDVVSIQGVIKDKNAQIDERVNGILTGLTNQVASLHAMVEKLNDQLDDAKKKEQDTVLRTAKYYEAVGKLDELRKSRDVLALQIDERKIDKQLPATTMVQIIEKAEPNDRPVKPRKALTIGAGLIVGLVVGFGLAFFIEYLDTSVKTIDDVERTLQAPVLGVIPQNVGYLLDEGAESPHAEAYRVLRTNLLFSRKDSKLNTVAVVSAGAGEGKSTTVCNLATVFAQSGQRVLMVDSDLRRPTLHRLIRVANTLGLTNYLLKQNTLEEVIQTTKLATLDFMASGKLPSSSLGILSSAQMKDLIGELKGRYDYVFFDSPPIMGVSDASILASEVDMTLQVIQYRRYPQPMNIRAKQLIEKVGGNLIGIVLNNINMAQDESYYYYSGYYHDYYGKNDDDEGVSSNGASKEKSRIDVKPKS